MTDSQLVIWLRNNLLTDSQLDIVPPGEAKTLRFRPPNPGPGSSYDEGYRKGRQELFNEIRDYANQQGQEQP